MISTTVIAAMLVVIMSVSKTNKETPDNPSALTQITFATDWKAQAEHGGFYQALALGFYEKQGLEVRIIPGGPGVNIPQILAAGSVDFGMGSNSFIPLNLVQAGAPVKAVMASFQKDPQVLITHPRSDIKSLSDMKGHPIMISDATISAFWIWLREKHQFTDDQIRKYTFNLAPFLVDKKSIQQGYLSSEPYSIEKTTGVAPQIFLLADNGYPSYGAFILAPTSRIDEEPEIVQAFVDASIEGWYSYLYDDPTPGNSLILRDNPEMSQDVLDQAIEKLRAYGIVDSGDAKNLGIGAMTDQRWQSFFSTMMKSGVYESDLDFRSAYTLSFVNKKHGSKAGQ